MVGKEKHSSEAAETHHACSWYLSANKTRIDRFLAPRHGISVPLSEECCTELRTKHEERDIFEGKG